MTTMERIPGTTRERLTGVTFFVPGKPAPQGSKRHVGKGILIESSKAVGPWRERVALAAAEAPCDLAAYGPPMFAAGEPLYVRLAFVMPRPASAGKKTTPPAVKRPDVDKLARAILDAITDVLIHDDSAVVDLHAHKRMAELDEAPGVHVTISTVA